MIFQSYGLTTLAGERVLEAYWSIAKHCRRFIGFELGTMFAPFGRIYDLDTYAGLMAIPNVSARSTHRSIAGSNGSDCNCA